jgi:hypothetical protein
MPNRNCRADSSLPGTKISINKMQPVAPAARELRRRTGRMIPLSYGRAGFVVPVPARPLLPDSRHNRPECVVDCYPIQRCVRTHEERSANQHDQNQPQSQCDKFVLLSWLFRLIRDTANKHEFARSFQSYRHFHPPLPRVVSINPASTFSTRCGIPPTSSRSSERPQFLRTTPRVCNLRGYGSRRPGIFRRLSLRIFVHPCPRVSRCTPSRQDKLLFLIYAMIIRIQKNVIRRERENQNTDT